MKFSSMLKVVVASTMLIAGAAQAENKWETIRIGTEGAYKPWNFTDASGTVIGFEIDLANSLCARMNAKCEIVAQDWDGIIPALNGGKYDAIMAGMNITDNRLKAIDFSRPYAISTASFGVPKDSPLAALAGTGKNLNLESDAEEVKKVIEEWKPLLEGKTIGFQGGTIIDEFFEAYLKDVFVLRGYKTTEQHDLDLAAGRIDAIFAAQAALTSTFKRPEFSDFVIAGAGIYGDIMGRGIAVGLRKTDPDLKAKFDEAIQSAVEDGTIEQLSQKWFGLSMTPKQ
ncbi:transporter substrate-binding domain-containing protein [Pseudaminobacter sp. 19-2017]|uniref:Transporter substrate-binding domain-containing protein n=1 Tax=Pseudaminobacter soli (ex Zhang et al. 2022) TaxID=2831468 RepID=A0A942IBL2_9HYPH|nr:transporter substrate-binding domain-containing protein [Pseudaminobacter soli]MBS3652415.1 transporter substrate-binding domain-containing protein [Pseudaminobacter soli]